MKKVFMLMTIIMVLFSSCDQVESSDQKLNRQQEQGMKEAVNSVGMPNIVNFQERKMMKMILELRDQEKLVCYAYIVTESTGKLIFIGKCIGYGLPYATQYTNPMKYEYQGVTIPQADPNGLFMPASAEGTWLLLVDPTTNEPRPVYIEPRVIVSPFKLNF